MALYARRTLALLSGLAFASSVAMYCASFAGLTLDSMHLWAFALHVGIFALFVPMSMIECPSMAQRTFFMKGYAIGKPPWIISGINTLGVFFAAHFILVIVLSHAPSPEIVTGQFVLSDHGTMKKISAEREYLRLKADELRLFATLWIFFYFATTAYWWFPSHQSSKALTA